MKHTIFSYYDNGIAFQESWTTLEIKSYVKSLMSSRGCKPYPFNIATRSHNNGEATEIDVISKKTGKVSKCHLAFMFGSFHCEPQDSTLFKEAAE
jgi:hypothetical protein